MLEIGLPLVNKDQETKELELAKQSFPSVVLYPLDTDMISDFSEGLLLYRLRPANDEDAPPRVKIYFEHQGPITESFTNNLTESFLSSIIRTSNNLSQLTQILGGQGIHEFAGQLLNTIPVLGQILTSAGTQIANAIPDTIRSAIDSALKGERFELPKLWQDSSSVINYTISFKLMVNNPDSNKEYYERIIVPIKTLMKYVLPRSSKNNSVVYRWPYFVKADAGGLFYVPEGMITDLTIEKVPEGWTMSTYSNRPSMINVRLTISSIRNTTLQSWNGNTPVIQQTLDTYIKYLSKQKQKVSTVSTPTSSKTKLAQNKLIPSKQISETDKNIYNNLKS